MQNHFQEIVDGRLRAKVGIALGEAYELAAIAERAGLHDLSLRCVDKAREALRRFPDTVANDWQIRITTLRMTVLVEQERWSDVLQEDVPSTLEATNALNLRALALQNVGKHEESLGVLTQVLRMSHRSEMALVNRVAGLLALRRYEDGLEAVLKAEIALGKMSIPLQINKAVSLAELGHLAQAREVALAIPADKRFEDRLSMLKQQVGISDAKTSPSNRTGEQGVKFVPKGENFAEAPRETFDVVLSYAVEDRAYVDAVARGLQARKVKVFYDRFEEVSLWGQDLYVYLNDVYRDKARYCVMFISESYARSLWTNHERKAALARAFQRNDNYILPARFDDTEVPGINQTTGHIDLRRRSEDELVELIVEKLRGNTSATPS